MPFYLQFTFVLYYVLAPGRNSESHGVHICFRIPKQMFKIRSNFKNVKQKNLGKRDMETDLITLH